MLSVKRAAAPTMTSFFLAECDWQNVQGCKGSLASHFWLVNRFSSGRHLSLAVLPNLLGDQAKAAIQWVLLCKEGIKQFLIRAEPFHMSMNLNLLRTGLHGEC